MGGGSGVEGVVVFGKRNIGEFSHGISRIKLQYIHSGMCVCRSAFDIAYYF